MGLPRKHISLESSNDVATICKPLFDKTDLNYFHYAKLYDDGSFSVLITNSYFHRHFWDMGYNKEFFPNFKEGIFFNDPSPEKGL